MNESTFCGFVIVIFAISGAMFTIGYTIGAGDGAARATNGITIQCIEKPNICKDRYQYLKLAERLEKNK